MSEITIFDKSQEIRFETELYANTCERVANVLDDINDTKANKVDVSASIQAVLDELALLEESVYSYVDAQDNDLRALINTKLTKPAMSTISDTFYYIRARVGLEPDYLPFNISTGRVPYWSGTSFFSSPITINSIYVGINKDSPTEALDVTGSVRANAFRYNVVSENSIPVKDWSDGLKRYFTDQDGVKKTFAFVGNIFEHNVRGKRVEATISGTYNLDLNTGSHFALTASAATVISFTNMILADETCALTMTVTGALLTLPAWLIRDSYSDVPDAAKTREYNIVIKRGGGSPVGRFNVINI